MKKGRLLHNYKLKAMSLVLATVSWLIVKQITNNDLLVSNVPVTFTLPEGWAIREKDFSEVKIRFLGTNKDIDSLNRHTVEVDIDLRKEEYEPEKVIQILPKHVSVAAGNLRIASIQPDRIEVQLGREGQKELLVKINQIGQPPEGIKLEAVEIEPPLATLVGAADLLAGINGLQTAPLNLSEKSQSFEQKLDILLPTSEWIGRVEPSRVQVKVTLAGETVEEKFSDIPLMLTYPAGQDSPLRQVVEPRQVDVFLKGSPQRLASLDNRRIQAFVSAEALEKGGKKEHKVLVLVPAGIEVLATQPEFVNVRTLAAPTATPKPAATPVPQPASTPVPAPDPTAVPAQSPPEK
ncbi:CdaR family protein [Kiritimatiellaeota bacterium B1221]|nr:CdaR family protein [Kiritimatiellaeota bacterium B1221]